MTGGGSTTVRVPEANGPYSLLRDEPLDAWLGRFADAGRYTIPGNEAGLPGIAIPVGSDSEGMPIGAMLYAGQGEEELLLRLAATLESEHPDWFGRVPPISVVESPTVPHAAVGPVGDLHAVDPGRQVSVTRHDGHAEPLPAATKAPD